MKKFNYTVILTCYMANITMECDKEEEAAQGALQLAVSGKLKLQHQAVPVFIAMKTVGLNKAMGSPGSAITH